MPPSLHERHVVLYREFADAWRVTNATSLFVYAPGQATADFTDRGWPSEQLPCKLPAQFEPAHGAPALSGMSLERAAAVCRLVTDHELHEQCVFDVATTGDPALALGYRLAQRLRERGTAVQLHTDKRRGRLREPVKVTVCITSLFRSRTGNGERPLVPRGMVYLYVDGKAYSEATPLDDDARAAWIVPLLAPGEHRLHAGYAGNSDFYPSSSAVSGYLVFQDCDEHYTPEEQEMTHTMDVPCTDGHTRPVKLDVKTARRMLAWVNAAHRPEDLLQPPPVLTHLHVEYRKRGFPFTHPPVDTHAEIGRHGGDHPEPGPPVGKEGYKAAVEVLKLRNEQPVYGFIRFEELFRSEWLLELLRWWWRFFSRASKGEWSGPYSIPAGAFDRPVHAAVLRTGKVLFFGLPTGKDSWLWTPDGANAGTTASTSNKPGDSLFCSGHSFLSDGRLLVAGGGGDGTGPRHNHAWIFNPEPGNESWTRTSGGGTPGSGDMTYYRWYPTLVTMGDEPGRVLVVSGDDTSGVDVAQMEVYFEATDSFELVWGPAGVGDRTADHSFPQIYPGMNLLPGGEVFYTPTGWHSGGCSGAADYAPAKPSGFYRFQTMSPPIKAEWTNVGTQDAAAEAALDRVKGMAVLLVQPSYPYVQVLVVGGGGDPESATTFQMINLSTLAPEWGPPVILPDGLARVNVNLVALPNGHVFVTGGRPLGGTPPNGGACWIYDPVAMTWQECDALANRRGYHSVAVLLPDGRVATAGNECPADTTYEIFSPPYLFAADGSLATRPEITDLAAQVHHGHSFTIQTPTPGEIDRVVLVRPMAVTHQTDSEQRVIQLQFHATGATELTATAPNGWHPHALAPRGWYMVFLVNHSRVPSLARFMHLH